MIFALKKSMTYKSFLTAIILLILPSFVLASPREEIILVIGGGYSLSPDEAARRWALDWAPSQIYFEEHLKLMHSFNFNIQYFFSREYGLKLEFHHQKGSYFSHLEWRGLWIGEMYYVVDHIEEPYTKPWSISSISASFLAALRRTLSTPRYPYAFVGAGFYILGGDQELVLDRIRLGPGRAGWLLTLGGGLKIRLSRSLNLDLRIFAEAITNPDAPYRRSFYTGSVPTYAGTIYAGTLQFSLDEVLDTGKIIRTPEALVRTFSYFGLDINLEFVLPRKKK